MLSNWVQKIKIKWKYRKRVVRAIDCRWLDMMFGGFHLRDLTYSKGAGYYVELLDYLNWEYEGSRSWFSGDFKERLGI